MHFIRMLDFSIFVQLWLSRHPNIFCLHFIIQVFFVHSIFSTNWTQYCYFQYNIFYPYVHSWYWQYEEHHHHHQHWEYKLPCSGVLNENWRKVSFSFLFLGPSIPVHFQPPCKNISISSCYWHQQMSLNK